jgi:hypothetical protein
VTRRQRGRCEGEQDGNNDEKGWNANIVMASQELIGISFNVASNLVRDRDEGLNSKAFRRTPQSG